VDEWFGMTPTGRQLREPTGTLHEAEDSSGVRHTVMAFDEIYRGHPALHRGIKLVESFLEHPMVVGLVELRAWNAQTARFCYPTGYFWTLKDLLRIYADMSMVLGLRAGLELGYLVGQILVEAAENGASQGCFCHGGLSPWRIGLRSEGDVIVFGYGLPQMDLARNVADPSFVLSPDSVRYAPPERLTGQPEGIASDTAAVVAITYEAITGQPLYAGHDLEQIKRSVSLAEAASVLSRPNNLPRPVATLFAQSLIFDPDSRLTGQAWLAQMADLHASHQQGESLADIAARIRNLTSEASRKPARMVSTEAAETTKPRAPTPLASTPASASASSASPSTASSVSSSSVSSSSSSSGPPSLATSGGLPETRWSRPTRRRGEAPTESPEPEIPEPPPLEATRRRRRVRGDEAPLSDEEPLTAPQELSASVPTAQALASVPRVPDRNSTVAFMSLPESELGDDEEEAVEPAPSEASGPIQRARRRADVPQDTSAPQRRRRRRDEPA
jgi:hypothetical protein